MVTEDLIRQLLIEIGEDPDRQDLRKTPQRVAQFWQQVTQGYRVDIESILKGAVITGDYNQMVVIKDIDFYSLCEHHLVPFWGKVHIGYIPDGKIVGLSKIPRIVRVFAQRLQVQERLTAQVADSIWDHLKPQGVAVVIEASHACMTARGVNTPGVMMTTSRMLGVFRDDERSRREVLALMGR